MPFRKTALVLAALAAVAALLFLWSNPESGISLYKNLISRFRGLSGRPMFFFFILCAVGPLFFIPVIILILTAGLLFGVLPGMAVASLGALASALISFTLGRRFRHGWMLDRLDRTHKYRALDNAVGREGWKIVVLLRLTPFFPFSVVNFALGAAKISPLKYAGATWLGMLPGIVVYAYLGSLAKNLAELSLHDRELSLWEWGLSALGAIAAVVLFLYFVFFAKNALKERLSAEEERDPLKTRVPEGSSNA